VPFETNPPLIVNADAVLALAVAHQCFKAIARQGGEITERCSRLHTIKLETCRPFEAGQRLYTSPGSELSGPLVPITDYHLVLQDIMNYALRQAYRMDAVATRLCF
jgi:hypothetical protein